MSSLIILAFIINAAIFSLILYALLDSIRNELSSRFRKFGKPSQESFKGGNRSSGEVKDFHSKKNRDYNHWDLSGGILGI